LSFDELCRLVDYWRLAADPDGAGQSDMDRRDRRRVNLDETFGGSWLGSMVLDPVSGTIVAGELERLADELFGTDWAEATERLGREPTVAELARTPDQRRADALVEMARRSGTVAPGGREPRPLFTLLLGSDAFGHLCQLASGRVLSPEALLPWICGADIERILFDGGPSRVIDVSHRRSFGGALRRLIEVRDRFCYHEYCDVPAHRCQVDHVVPWSAGGVTDQTNGRLACGYHNRLRHRRPPPPG